MAPIRSLFLGASITLLVAGCAGNPPPALTFPPISFSQEAPIKLDVARIEVVSQFKPPAERPHIEYDMPVSPETAVRRWATDRLRAVGHDNVLRVLIKDATATETPVKTEKGLAASFKDQTNADVAMNIDIALQVLDQDQYVVSEVTYQTARSHTEIEGMKLNDRDQLLYDMVNDMARSMDHDIKPNIDNTFGRWLGNN
jgi:hypothetical protein